MLINVSKNTFSKIAPILILMLPTISEADIVNYETDGKSIIAHQQRGNTAVSVRFLLQNAAWSSWFTVGSCSVSCGGSGFQERRRNCSTGIVKDCEAVGGRYWEVIACNSGPCVTTTPSTPSSVSAHQPAWSSWSTFSPCSKSCGGSGYQERVRNCSTGNVKDCQAFGATFWEVIFCHSGPCVTAWNSWSAFGSCSTSCGYSGFRDRTRNCSTGNVRDCQAVGGTFWETEVCNNGPCVTATSSTPSSVTAHQPAWSSWSTFGPCSKSCGGSGYQERVRNCSSGNVKDCETVGGRSWEVITCNSGPCVTAGQWSKWFYDDCATSCGNSTQQRFRHCSTGRDADCDGSPFETIPCLQKSCPGYWLAYQNVTSCSATCGVGFIGQRRKCRTGNDADCTGISYNEIPCHLPDC